ncbi:MAG: hypothetical protein GXP55_07580 [Deltaproteobacteria bacterium]|nr:hypothetical protein [Deltaproteobacteria bacterium]
MPAGRRAPEEPQRPHMFMGDEAHPVHAWMWDATGGGTFAEGGGTGPRQDYVAQPPDAVQVHGTSRWHRGRWRVVFRRDLHTPDVEDDAQIEAGGLVPFALRVWDGSAGERGLQSATSSWHYMYLEMPTPPRAYLLGLVATCVIYLLIGLAWWRTRGHGGGQPPPRPSADARTTSSKNGLASRASSSVAKPIFPRTP